MQCVIKDIVDFYNEFPEEIGNLDVDTRFGFKTIQFADITAFDSEIIRIELEDGNYIETSLDHQLMSDIWINVKDLTIEDVILTKNGKRKIVSIEELDIKEDLYDLQVEEVHEFYANNIVSHNSTILNSLSYALFGQAISDIRKDNLINNLNKKNMLVRIEFSVDNKDYIIERGRKPGIFKFLIDNSQFKAKDEDESQGESKLTQREVEKTIGMSFDLFCHIVALNTSTEPFLKLKSKEQREFIEELLGMKILSEKATTLKQMMDLTKTEIKLEEVKIQTIKQNNIRIEKNIEDVIAKCEAWEVTNSDKILKLEEKLEKLNHIDIENELVNHKNNQEIRELEQSIQQLKKDKSTIDRQLLSLSNSDDKAVIDLEKALENKCPTCDQGIHDEKHENIINQLTTLIENNSKLINKLEPEKVEINKKLLDKEKLRQPLGSILQTYHTTIDRAYNHKSDVELCANDLENAKKAVNPYFEHIESLQTTAVQEIDFTVINELSKSLDHQEFLYKLLTDNGSFVRKKIIDQNIAFLNCRLMKYLDKLALPHNVTFQNDLTVNITNFGHELDFGSLSHGEATRLILALSWAFRDIYEVLVRPINIMLIDELLDAGADSSCTEQAVSVLRAMNQDLQKNIFLISHKDSLVSKISSVLLVTKENGFTSLSLENNYVSA